MHELYELKDKLMKELEEYSAKEVKSTGSLEVIDKLSHAIKNICKIIEAGEEEEYSGRYAYEGGSMRGGSMRGGSYDGSYERGGSNRGSYAQRRDSRGRYSRERGYSRGEDMVMELKELMQDAPDEKTRQEFQRFIQKIEMM